MKVIALFFLAAIAGLPPIRPLFDHPVRDTTICRAPDGYYYLTGTTGDKTGGPDMLDGWWYVNRGIELWRSRDLKDWDRLGLVWSVERDGTWQNGRIARLKDDMSGLAEEPRQLRPANHEHVGFEGAFLAKVDGKYLLLCAEFNPRDGTRTYDCMAAVADSVYGPYGERYLAIPHGGHNMIFRDRDGGWWSTFFGHDALAPFRERPAILRIAIGPDGKISVAR